MKNKRKGYSFEINKGQVRPNLSHKGGLFGNFSKEKLVRQKDFSKFAVRGKKEEVVSRNFKPLISRGFRKKRKWRVNRSSRENL